MLSHNLWSHLKKIKWTEKEKRIALFEPLQGSARPHPRAAKSENKFLISVKHFPTGFDWINDPPPPKANFYHINRAFSASGEPKHDISLLVFPGQKSKKFVCTAWKDGIFTGNNNSMDTSTTTAPEIHLCKQFLWWRQQVQVLTHSCPPWSIKFNSCEQKMLNLHKLQLKCPKSERDEKSHSEMLLGHGYWQAK